MRLLGVIILICSILLGYGYYRHIPSGYANQYSQESSQENEIKTSCFSGQYINQKEDILNNIVNILVVSPSGTHTGTGSIIANTSGDNGHNKILTAGHVINFDDIKAIIIFDRFGHEIGNATIEYYKKNYNSHSEFVRNDISILSVIPKNDLYDSYTGLKIAKKRSYGVSYSYIHKPVGVTPGASGAPAINSDGEIVGVLSLLPAYLTKRVEEMTHISLKNYNTIRENWKDDQSDIANISIITPVGDYVEFAPISSPDIQTKLNIHELENTSEINDVIIPGYPHNGCLIYKGDIKTGKEFYGLPKKIT